MRVALIQMLVTADKAANLRSACEKIRAAKQAGADIAVLPEMFCCPYENRCFRAYGEEAGGEVQQTLSRLAAELNLYIVGGSIPELAGENVYNTSFAYGRDGKLLASIGRPTSLTSTSQGGNPSGSPTRFPREMPSPHLKPPSAPWAFASALTCALRSWPGACVCAGPRCSSSPPPSI